MTLYLLLFFVCGVWALDLDYVLKSAIKNSPELDAIRQDLLSARASLDAEKQLYLPEVFLSYRLNYNSEKQSFQMPAFGGATFQTSKQSYSTLQGGLRYFIFDGGSRAGLVETATSNLRSKNFLYEEKLQSLKLEVIQAYFDVLSAKALIEAIEKQKEAVEVQLKTAQAFYERGLVAITDVLQARVRLAEVERDLRQAIGNYKLALGNLSRLSALAEDQLTHLQEPKVEIDIKPLDYYLEAAGKRNLLQAQREAVEISKAQRKVFKSQFYPKIFLEALYTYSDQNPAIKPKGLFSLSLGLSLSFQGIRPYFQEISAQYLELKAQREYQDLLEKIKLDTKKAYEEVLTAKDNLKVSEEALAFAEKFFELSKEQYLNQLISQRELLEAEASLTRARINRIISYYQLLKSYHRLLFVSGLGN